MSHTLTRITPQEYAPPAMIDRMRARCLTVGAVFAVLAIIGAVTHWNLFLRAWLFSYLFWLGLTMGSLVLLMLQYTSGGNWGRLGRRIWEAGAGNLWLMALFFIPILIGMWTDKLFPWTHMSPQELGPDKVKYYLNPTLFTVRAVIYFAVWSFLAWKLYRWSQQEEAGTTTPARFVRIQNLSGFGIVFYGMSITLATIDWAMSLYPQWWSTVWGMLFMVGQVLTTFCFTIWLLTRLAAV